MKFSTILPYVVSALLSITAVSADYLWYEPRNFTLERRTTPSLIRSPQRFYRAVKGAEMAHVHQIYPEGRHPTTHKTEAGDFSAVGGLYVFHDEWEAIHMGECYAQLPGHGGGWYVVEFEYTPDRHLATQTFTSDDAYYKQFVDDNNRKKTSHPFAIIEGPLSCGSGSGTRAWKSPRTGEDVYQAAFVGSAALRTLTVKKVKGYGTQKSMMSRVCPPSNCVIQ